MEELFVYALLSSIGYEVCDHYRNTLDALFLSNSQDEILLNLESRTYKDAILHLLYLMNVSSFDIVEFGKILMHKIRELYAIDNLDNFSKSMYKLWQRLPQNIGKENPFHILSYADEPLSWGDEKQCRDLYEEAFKYFDQ